MPLLDDVEMPLIEVLAAMEAEGLKLDTERLAAISDSLAGEAERLEAEIWELAGHEFTIGSPQQLGEVLFTELGLSRKRRGKTGFSTDARVLSQIRDEHEIVAKVERWREVTKLKNTYLDTLPGLIDSETGRIHTTFSQVRAATGRLSSTNPNLQNIPIRSELGRPVRGCFVADEGHVLVSCDYNQVELRVLAHVANDETLREIFASGADVHSATAAEIIGADPDAVSVGDRSKAKMVNYGIAYGLSAFGLADRLNIDVKEAAAYIDRYFERFDGVKRFIDETIEKATDEGQVTTLLGRRRLIPELRSRNRQTRGLGERLAVNTIIQGTAADIIKLAMIRSHAAIETAGLQSRLILQIHDELLFEGPESEADAVAELARREMVDCFPLDPPLAVDTRRRAGLALGQVADRQHERACAGAGLTVRPRWTHDPITKPQFARMRSSSWHRSCRCWGVAGPLGPRLLRIRSSPSRPRATGRGADLLRLRPGRRCSTPPPPASANEGGAMSR